MAKKFHLKCLIIICLTKIALPCFADLQEVSNRTAFSLQEADKVVYQALYDLSLRYENSHQKTQISTEVKTLAHGPIEKIICGYFPDTSSQNCPDTTGTATIIDQFSACLVKPYPHQLGCEVQFHTQASHQNLSGALSGKKALFIAQGPGLYPVSINKNNADWFAGTNETFTPKGMDHINSYICYNPDGSPGDGINNGGRMGSVAICSNGDCTSSNATVTLYPLNLSVTPISKLGSIISCLQNTGSST